MSVATVKPQLATLQATISGVVRAFADAPNTVSMADMPCFVNLVGESEIIPLAAEGVVMEKRTYRMLLFVAPRTTGVSGEAENKCAPFFDRVRDFFLARPQLNKLATVQLALFQGDTGTSVLTYQDVQFYGIEFRIAVTEVKEYTYVE